MLRTISLISSCPEAIRASHRPLLPGTHLVEMVCLRSAATTVLPAPTSPRNAIVLPSSDCGLVSRIRRSTSAAVSPLAPSTPDADSDMGKPPNVAI